MRRVVLPSFAKINLTLEVLNKRPDGFHNLRTIFHTISLADTLTIDYEESDDSNVSVEGIDVSDNLILRAARAVLDAAGRGAKLRFHIEKRIPMGGGLGGGSSNAAVTLLAVSRLLGAVVDLPGIAATLGSDVPFFLEGGCGMGTGRGTEITPLPDGSPLPLLLVTPGIHVSTPSAFAWLSRPANFQSSTDSVTVMRDLLGSGHEFNEGVNDFELPVFESHPELADLRQELLRQGALASRMSGSGSSLFGVFRTEQQRDAAAFHVPGSHSVRFIGRCEYRRSLQL